MEKIREWRTEVMRRIRRQPQEKETERKIFVNKEEKNVEFKYADNHIKTSKYNALTFIPVNLFEQFQRIANFYFLMLMILQWIPYVSSLTPYTTMIPLFSVLAVTAIKDIVDDVQRHRSDNLVNGRKSLVLRNGVIGQERWDSVRVGDIIRMEDNQFVAADLLLLSSSEPNGLVYIETAELDGETNLKPRQALTETMDLQDDNKAFADLQAYVNCEPPNEFLSRFEGVLRIGDDEYPVTNKQILLRGCVLRNTKWCYGVVVFAGTDTKLMQNSGKSKLKQTNIDRLLNYIIIGIVVLLTVICIVCSFACGIWEYRYGQYFKIYLPWDDIVADKSTASAVVITATLMFFSYIIVMNTLVPISLYVSVEIVRLAQSVWINWDVNMCYGETYAKSRTTTLTEQLGQINYILSDKTGTLTQNIMTFKKCSINGARYGDLRNRYGEIVEDESQAQPVDFSDNPVANEDFRFYDPSLQADLKKKDENCDLFFRCLSLCHTVMPEEKNGKLFYQAQSPDEGALVDAAKNFGYVFVYRTPDKIRVQIFEEELEYNLLDIIDFNNVRKRMSVILERDGQIVLYCKGADSMIIERLAQTPENLELVETTNEDLEYFAGEGLRTLCLAWKHIDKPVYDAWKEEPMYRALDRQKRYMQTATGINKVRYREAQLAMENREEKCDEVAEEIEKELLLIGASAIEDKLQDGVPDAIASLARADIKIWVLTGDKLETAVNIGYSCRLLTEEMREVFVVDGDNGADVREKLQEAKDMLKDVQSNKTEALELALNPPAIEKDEDTPDSATAGQCALVIEGKSLAFALEKNMEDLLVEVACSCVAVICCRVTPLQKAQVVELVKRHKNATTLAIGDGANDVSMIKAAHIGVGISGQEGMQAVLASDYSIGQFRFLKRLLLVHGRWSYYRMAKFLRYFFYKNFAFTLMHLWYGLYCGFSAQNAYDPLFITFYNLLYTATPIVLIAIFDQDVSDQNSLDFPQLYTPGHKDLFFNKKMFAESMVHGIITSLMIFFVCYFALHYYVDDVPGIQTFGTALATTLFVTVTVEVALETAHWTFMNFIFIFGSVVLYFALSLIMHDPAFNTSYVGAELKVYGSPAFWFTLIITVTILTVPLVVARFLRINLMPTLSDRVRYRQRFSTRRSRTIQLQSRPSLATSFSRASIKRGSRTKFKRSGYAFAHEKGFGELITSGLNMLGGKESGSVRLFFRHKKRSELDVKHGMKVFFGIQEHPEEEMREVSGRVVNDEVDRGKRTSSHRTTTF